MRATLVPLALALLALLAPPGVAAAKELEIAIYLHELEGGTLHLLPPEINAEVGDTLVLTVTNQGQGEHDLVVCGDGRKPQSTCEDVLGATGMIAAQQSETLRVTLEEPGDFDYYCSIPTHKTAGMRGVLHVTGEAASEKATPAPTVLALMVLLSAAALALRRRTP